MISTRESFFLPIGSDSDPIRLNKRTTGKNISSIILENKKKRYYIRVFRVSFRDRVQDYISHSAKFKVYLAEKVCDEPRESAKILISYYLSVFYSSRPRKS